MSLSNRTQDHRQLTKVLVIAAPYNVTGDFSDASKTTHS